MSGLCPFAVHKIIPPGSNDPAITPRMAILHVDAGNASSLYEFFRDRSGGIESHFFVQRDGGLEQYRDIGHQADANLHANDFAISIETQGFGAGEWTPEQVATIKRLLLWLHDEADIPLTVPKRWDGSGVGYHTQFGAPGPWTPVAKSCPGPDRVKQYHNVLVPWMASNPQEDDMPYLDWPQKDRDALLTDIRKELHGGDQARFQRLVKVLRGAAQAERKRDAHLAERLDKIADDAEAGDDSPH